MTAHFDLPRDAEPDTLHKSLNGMLPKDIAIKSIDVVPLSFHARFDAVSRSYRYEILTSKSALLDRYCWIYQGELDVEAMGRAAESLLGTHDFIPFSKLNPEVKHYRCTIFAVNVARNGEKISFYIRGNRFMHSMVRALTGTLSDIGRGALPESTFKEVLESGEKPEIGGLAPPHGLYLDRVQYSNYKR